MVTPEEKAAIAARHDIAPQASTESWVGNHRTLASCAECGFDWPCDAARLPMTRIPLPRLPDGRVDWLIVEGDVMIAAMVAAIVLLVIHAVLNGGH